MIVQAGKVRLNIKLFFGSDLKKMYRNVFDCDLSVDKLAECIISDAQKSIGNLFPINSRLKVQIRQG